jgi:hypothetical protein
VADVPTWPAGDLWRIGLRRVFELQRTKLAQCTAEKSARDADSGSGYR